MNNRVVIRPSDGLEMVQTAIRNQRRVCTLQGEPAEDGENKDRVELQPVPASSPALPRLPCKPKPTQHQERVAHPGSYCTKQVDRLERREENRETDPKFIPQACFLAPLALSALGKPRHSRRPVPEA